MLQSESAWPLFSSKLNYQRWLTLPHVNEVMANAEYHLTITSALSQNGRIFVLLVVDRVFVYYL